jgi:hypothetical protein
VDLGGRAALQEAAINVVATAFIYCVVLALASTLSRLVRLSRAT